MQKSRTKCSFVKIEAYYASDLGLKKTNKLINIDAGRLLYLQRYYLYENVYYSGTSLKRSPRSNKLFLTPAIIKYKTI